MHLAPFADDLLRPAADLLAMRHRAHRAAAPLLPARFESPEAALAAVSAVWRKSGASGVAALDRSRLVGFMLGTAQVDSVRERHVWVPLAGHALAPDQDPDLYRDMYASLADQWCTQGHFYHLAQVPTADRATLDAWFALGFGHEQAHALHPLTPGDNPVLPPGVEVRRARPDDLDLLLDVAGLIATHQARAPVFGVALQEARYGWNSEWAELLSDPAITVWLAVREGRVIAFQAYVPAPATEWDMLVPDRCALLEVAATRPEARGQGLGRLLTAVGLKAAHEAGYACCLADWRVTNLLSSRFWPRQGFEPVVYRLSRRIDPRIAWAHG